MQNEPPHYAKQAPLQSLFCVGSNWNLKAYFKTFQDSLIIAYVRPAINNLYTFKECTFYIDQILTFQTLLSSYH